jgi:hypothetical protein
MSLADARAPVVHDCQRGQGGAIVACAGFFKAKAVVPIPIEAQARESEPVKRLSLFKEAVEILRQGESHVVPLTWGYSGGMMDYRLQNFYVPGSEQIVKHFEHLWWDLNTRVFSVIGVAFPTFWLGILIVYALATFFQWLPPLGYATVWDDPLLNLQQLIFPALTLAFHDLAFTARVTRSSMLEVMREDYMRTARQRS